MEATLKIMQQYCAYQERCHSEVRHKLLELKVRGMELEEIIAALVSEGFLNEERFARAYCSGKFRIKQWGRKKIIQGLKQKQVSDYCIQKGLTEIDEKEYKDTALSVARKKRKELVKEKSEWIRNQKVYRYLLQKGYEQDLASEIVESFRDI